MEEKKRRTRSFRETIDFYQQLREKSYERSMQVLLGLETNRFSGDSGR